MSITVVDVTDPAGLVVQPELLRQAERVHRELRPQLPEDYTGKMGRVFAGGGRMTVAVVDGAVVGVAIYRVYENTFQGVQLYVDDLVTESERRSTGVGHALMEHLEAVARAHGCVGFNLDSGVQRAQAHKFYFREGMVVTSFHFGKAVGPARPARG